MTETAIILLVITLRSLAGSYEVVEIKQAAIAECRIKRDDRAFWAQHTGPGQAAIGASCVSVIRASPKGEDV